MESVDASWTWPPDFLVRGCLRICLLQLVPRIFRVLLGLGASRSSEHRCSSLLLGLYTSSDIPNETSRTKRGWTTRYPTLVEMTFLTPNLNPVAARRSR